MESAGEFAGLCCHRQDRVADFDAHVTLPCSEQVKSLTNLDASELCQLLQLFYDVRKDSDVALDTDVAPVPEMEAIDENAAKGEEEAKDQTFCRKCRRAKSKCVCGIRAKAPIDESSIPLEEMLQEALVLRDEMLCPDD